MLYLFLSIRRPYPDTGEYRSRYYNQSHRYYRSRTGKHKIPWLSDSRVLSCRRMERTLLGNAKSLTQLRGLFH